MAKNRKIPGKPKKPAPPPKDSNWDVLQQKANAGGEDVDSDVGSFLDDDTEDFLPSKWTGNTTKSKAKSPKRKPTSSTPSYPVKAEKTASKDVKCTISSTISRTITFNPLQPCFRPGMIYTVDTGNELDSDHHTVQPRRLSSVENQLVIETSQLSLEGAISSETFNSLEDQLCSNAAKSPVQSPGDQQVPTLEENPLEDTTTKTQANTVTISRLQVPVSLIRLSQPRSEMEKVQDENATLRRDLAKKERELKSSKAQLTRAASDANKQEDDAQRLRNELTEQYKIRYGKQEEEVKGLQLELKETQSERQKATLNLRLEREVMRRLRQTAKDLGEKLRAECAKSSILQGDVDKLKNESCQYKTSSEAWNRQYCAAEQNSMALETKLATETAMNNKLLHQLSGLRNELSGATATRATIVTKNDETYRALKQRCNTLVLESQTADQRLLTTTKDLSICRQERDSAKEKIRKVTQAWAVAYGDISTRDQSITDLKSKVSLLESDRDLKAPFIQKAVDLRLRFLEQAREMILKVSRGDVDLAIIQNGNNAAHRAYGALDAALFQLNLIPEEYKATGETIFEKLYTVKPDQYGNWYPKAERLLDCRASIYALKPINRSNSTQESREEHGRIDTEIVRHQRMSWQDFESSKVVEELIVKLENLTDEIIQLDRSRHGGQRRRNPRTDNVSLDDNWSTISNCNWDRD